MSQNQTNGSTKRDEESSEDELPKLLEDDSEEDEDELPPLLEDDENSDDELPPLVDSEASDSDDDKLPELIEDDSDSDDDENWETDDSDDGCCQEHYLGDDGIVYYRLTHREALPPLVSPSSSEDSEEDDEEDDSDYETTSSDSDVNFPLFMPSSRSANRLVNQRGGNTTTTNRQRIRATRDPPFVLPGLPPHLSSFLPVSDEEDLDVDDDSEDEYDSEDENPFNPRMRDSQGISHISTRSGTHNKYWTQISAREKSKLDDLYKNTEDSFKFNTTSPASSSSSASSSSIDNPMFSIPIGNGLQLFIHNMEEFLDGIMQVITSHSLHAMEVSSQFEYSRMAQKQVVQNRNVLLLLIIMLAIKLKYLRD